MHSRCAPTRSRFGYAIRSLWHRRQFLQLVFRVSKVMVGSPVAVKFDFAFFAPPSCGHNVITLSYDFKENMV